MSQVNWNRINRGEDVRTSPIKTRRSPGPFLPSLAVFVLLFCAAWPAVGQDVRVQIGRGPYYIGEPVEIQVVASDFDEATAPEVVAGKLDAGQLRYGGVSNSSTTSINFVNGRMTRIKEVLFVFRFELIAASPGRIRIPGFAVTQGATKRTTNPFDLEIGGVPSTGLVGLTLKLPKGPVFVGQKVPIQVELRIDREAQQDLISYQAVVPLFESQNLRFLDDPSQPADTQLEIETSAGTLRLGAVTTEERVGGRIELVVRAQRTMIALAPEEIRADPPHVVISRGTRFRRDIFNQRQPGSSERLMAEGDPVRIEVIEVPREGRPPSFAGAVGAGFTLEVAADRSVVQLGEPILVSFRVRGNGDLSTVGLPPLDADGLLDPNQFRLPDDRPAGLVDADGKLFEASLRVLDADVREIPPIAYSWFDADSRSFETTHSLPIALSVGAAEIIGADAVDRRSGAQDDAREEQDQKRRERNTSGAGPVRSTSLSFSGANLAVEQDQQRVLSRRIRTTSSPAVVPVLYAVGVGVFALAAFDHRRRSVDPRSRERSRTLREARRAIEASASLMGSEGAAALGRALREMVAALPDQATPEFDALISECDALRFAPSTSGGALPPALIERALAFVAAEASPPGSGPEGRSR